MWHLRPTLVEKRDTSREGDEALVRVLYPKQASSGLGDELDGTLYLQYLREGTNNISIHLEEDGSLCLLHCNVHRTEPCTVHPEESNQVCAIVHNSNVHLGKVISSDKR